MSVQLAEMGKNGLKFFIEHIGLAARDTTTLKDWYVRMLGARVIFTNSEIPPAFFVELPGGLMIEIYASGSARKETSDNRLAGWRHLALQVESIERARAALAARGVVFTEETRPAGGGGTVLFFQDGEGNLLHLVERPADSLFLQSDKE
ncbi:MAG: VOC family protein [Verrucomicrobiota bacterium]